jgi:hypothetical protein
MVVAESEFSSQATGPEMNIAWRDTAVGFEARSFAIRLCT